MMYYYYYYILVIVCFIISSAGSLNDVTLMCARGAILWTRLVLHVDAKITTDT